MGEVHGMGTGPAGLAGAAGFAAAGAAGAAGFGADAGGVADAGADGAIAGGTAFSAVGLFSPSGGGGAGGLVSSAILFRSVWRYNSRETIWKGSLLTACQSAVNDLHHINHASGPRSRLIALDQLPDPLRIGLAMPMAGDRIGPACRLNHDVGPEDSGRNVHGCHLMDADAFFVASEQAGLDAAHMLGVDHDAGWKKQIALRPTAGGERFSVGNGSRHKQ